MELCWTISRNFICAQKQRLCYPSSTQVVVGTQLEDEFAVLKPKYFERRCLRIQFRWLKFRTASYLVTTSLEYQSNNENIIWNVDWIPTQSFKCHIHSKTITRSYTVNLDGGWIGRTVPYYSHFIVRIVHCSVTAFECLTLVDCCGIIFLHCYSIHVALDFALKYHLILSFNIVYASRISKTSIFR